jgi:hypothetical protein
MTCKGALFAGLLAACSAVASTAGAQQPSDRRAEARARASEGLALHKQGDDAGALVKFQQAYALVPMPEILFDMALAEQRVGRLLDAQAGYRKCLADPTFSTHAAEVQKHLDELKAQLGHLKIDAPPATVLTIDGQPVADWSVPIDVMPGTHAIDASNGWHVTRSVDAPAGQQVSVVLGAPEAPVPESSPAPSSPAPAPAVDTGPSSAGMSSSTKLIVSGSLAGLAVVSAGVGLVFGLQSISKGNDAASLNAQAGSTNCPAAGATICNGLKNDYDAQKTDSTLASVFYVAGGVLAAGAVATWLLWPQSSKTESGWIAPSFGPGSLGMAAGARF